MSGARRNWLAGLIIFLGIGFIVGGIFRGEAEVVLQKAVHICLECIGIG